MKRFISASSLLVVCILTTVAQNKLLTLDDIFDPDAAKRVRFGGTPVAVQWAADGRSFKQLINGRLMRVRAETGEAAPYYDSDRLVGELQRNFVPRSDAVTIANSPTLQFNKDDTGALVNSANDLWYFNITSGVLMRLTNDRDAELEADFSPDGKWVSFVRGNNLYVVDALKGGEKQLTRDGREGSKAIYNGYLDWIYEEELYGRGQKRGYWWSPDSRYVAFLRLDEAQVPKWVIPNDVPQDQSVEDTYYPQAGDPNPVVRLGIADVARTSILPSAARIPKIGEKLPPILQRIGDAVKFVDISQYKPDDLLIGRVGWSPSSRFVTFQALNREQTSLDVNAADLTGKVNKVLTETSPAWVEVYDNPLFLQDGSVVWQSARNGWKHLYLYGPDGQLKRQLTGGKWEVRNVYGVDEKGGWVYFSATKDSYVAENIYRVSLTQGGVERLSRGDGWHAAGFNRDFTRYVENWSDVNNPTQTRLFNADGSLVRILNENRVDVLGQYRLSRPEFLNVMTRDGFQLEAMMIKPPDFDPSRRYPVLEFTYSGPHAPQVANRWGGNRGMWFQLLAQKGYIVWVLDNRTASGKGEESAWPVYKEFGKLELRDLEDGVNYLRSLPYVDGSRIGLHGWSYGGFMTSYAMTHSTLWKVGIAGGTVSDFRNYDSIYTDRYMLTPQHNPDGYDRTSVLKAAKNLSGRLMLIHGQIDDNVHLQNTTQLAFELQKADKQFDLMLYPTARHGVTNPNQVKHWYTMMTDFILRNL